MTEKKKTVYEIVTERFMEQLKQGIVPWEKPWVSIKGARVGGWSHTTGVSYSMLNQMMLPSSGEYITFKQIQKEGGKLKKGSTGYPITFWKSFTVTQKDENNADVEVAVPVLRYYMVYSLEDVEGIEPNYQEDTSKLDGLKEPQRCKKAEELIKSYVERSGLTIKHQAQDRAYYSPIRDEVSVPLKKQFAKKAEYYGTLFHELVHSTGHRERLNRLGTAQAHKRKEYSLEELVAEMGAAAILFNLGIETKASVENANAYLQSWYTALSNDPRMIVKASSRAQKAVKYIYGEDVTPSFDVKPIDTTKEKLDTNLTEIDTTEECPF